MSGKRKETLCVLALIIVGLLFFYKTFSFDFINLDDPLHTSANIAVRTFDLKGLLFKFYLGLYHPLTTLSFAIDWWLGGGTAWMFHLSNFIFHILGTLVLLKICLKLWPERFLLGFLISLIFMLHPLKIESVAWITERKDVLSGFFLWLTIYLYLFYLDNKKMRFYVLSNLAFFFSLAGKVSVVPLPIFLLVLDWYRNKGFTLRSLINKTPFFLLSFIFGLLNVLEQSRVRADLNVPPKNYFDVFYEIQFYLEKFLFPWNLRPQYSIEYLDFNVVGVASFALFCFLSIFILRRAPQYKKDLILGLSLFILSLFPNLRLIPSYGDGDIVHDRYMYIALTGLTIAFFPFILHYASRAFHKFCTYVFLWSFRRKPESSARFIDPGFRRDDPPKFMKRSTRLLWRKEGPLFSFAIPIMFVAFGFQWLGLMHLQIPYWKDSVTLWQHAAVLEPDSKLVSGNLGKALMQAGRLEEALPYLQKSEGRAGDFEDLGYVLNALNRQQEAENILLKGLEAYPEHSLLLNMLGVIKYDNNEYGEALQLFARAFKNLHDDPGLLLHTNVLNNLGLAYMQLGNHREAERFYREALAVYKNNSTIIHNLGLILFKQNRLEEAKKAFLHELELNPNQTETSNIVGAIFYLQKDFGQARAWFRHSLKLDPKSEAAKSILLAMDREGN